MPQFRTQTAQLGRTATGHGPVPDVTGSAVGVSVVIPAYNAAPYIAETLDSVLNQSFAGYEVIVVNDGSPDRPQLERVLAPYRTRIVYLTQPNRGPSAARNHGIRQARGEYVAFLDSDDVWMPEYLATQMRILLADPSLALLYSNGVVIGDVPYAGHDLMSMAPSQGPVTFERLIGLECTVLTSCVVARRQAVIDAGLFDERFMRSEDFHLWSRLAYRGARIAYHREVLVKHRRRGGSLSDDATAMMKAAIEVLHDLEASLSLTERQKSLVARHIASCRARIALEEGRCLFVSGEYGAAAAAIGRSLAWEARWWQRMRLRTIRLGLLLAPRLIRGIYRTMRGSPGRRGTRDSRLGTRDS